MKAFQKILTLSKRVTRGICNQTSPRELQVEVHSPEHEVVIALGSNVGNRVQNFYNALSMMRDSGVRITRHACMYETEPAHVTDQPLFLNSAVRGFTTLGPHELLASLKKIEKELGRTEGIRYGPRLIDLDIIFYGKHKVCSEVLTIPHERVWERPFVLAPLTDLLGLSADTDSVVYWHSLSTHSGGIFGAWEKLVGESSVMGGMKRVLPIRDRLWDWSNKTHVAGVLNLTPDSFSDGGKFLTVETAVSHVKLMISQGAEIIDIGAQSTRPLAPKVTPQVELSRLMPVLNAVLNIPEAEGKLFSVDTFYSIVAQEVISKGVHMINDVSGGRLDADMLSVVAKCHSPYVVMHMRGDPSTMQNNENLVYGDVCSDVASELYSRVQEAEISGVPAWQIILDPGLGFSKTVEQNLQLLGGIPTLRHKIAHRSIGLSHAPIMIGPSRKSFLGKICNLPNASERDSATMAAVTVGVMGGANIARVHNVKDTGDVVKVCDAMLQQRTSS